MDYCTGNSCGSCRFFRQSAIMAKPVVWETNWCGDYESRKP